MDEAYDIIRCVRDKRYKYIRNFEPDKPYAQRIRYMELMPTMRIWRQLAAAGELTGPTALFFRPTKPAEELYDLQRDPLEQHNVIDDPAYQDVAWQLRTRVYNWMVETNDPLLYGDYPPTRAQRERAEERPMDNGVPHV